MDWRPGWTQPLHTETYSRHNPLNTPPQEPTRSLAGGAVPGTWWVGGDRSLDGQVARRQAGWHVVYGKPASRASGWEPPATLIPFSVCHAVLLAGCALSSEVTCTWTWKHVNRMGVKTATKERHSLKADLSTVNRFQRDNDPDILCKIMGNYLHTH